MIVYFVQGNDFPEAAFSTEELAEAYCVRLRAYDKAQTPARRIYWKVYAFVVDEKLRSEEHK